MNETKADLNPKILLVDDREDNLLSMEAHAIELLVRSREYNV